MRRRIVNPSSPVAHSEGDGELCQDLRQFESFTAKVPDKQTFLSLTFQLRSSENNITFRLQLTRALSFLFTPTLLPLLTTNPLRPVLVATSSYSFIIVALDNIFLGKSLMSLSRMHNIWCPVRAQPRFSHSCLRAQSVSAHSAVAHLPDRSHPPLPFLPFDLILSVAPEAASQNSGYCLCFVLGRPGRQSRIRCAGT